MIDKTKQLIESKGFEVLEYLDTIRGDAKNFLGVDKKVFKAQGDSGITAMRNYLMETITNNEELNMFKMLNLAFKNEELTESQIRSMLILYGRMGSEGSNNIFDSKVLRKEQESEFFRNMLKKGFSEVMNKLVK